MFFGARKKRQPGVWFDTADPAFFPEPGTPEYGRKLIAGDLAVASYDPEQDKVEVAVAQGLERYKELRTRFYGYVRTVIQEEGLKRELGKAKAAEIEQRAKAYPYYKEKAQLKALARLQLNQPIPVKGRPGEFWWPPKQLSRRPPVRGGTPEERQEIYDEEAERWAKYLILHGQFRELIPFIDPDTWLEEEDL